MGPPPGRGRGGRRQHLPGLISDPFLLQIEAEEPLVGWRYWQVSRSGRLRSVTKKWIEWEPGHTQRAVCLEVGHASPALDCSCGLYGIDELDRLRQHGLCLVPNVAVVVGRVALWGRVADDGGAWRAEMASPLSLSLVEGTLADDAVAPTVEALRAYEVTVGTVALDEAVAGVSAAVLDFQAMSATTNRWDTGDPDG